MKLNSESTSIFGIFANAKGVYAGDEEGNIVELSHEYVAVSF